MINADHHFLQCMLTLCNLIYSYVGTVKYIVTKTAVL